MKRRTFIQHTGLAAGMIAATPLLANCVPAEEYDFPLVDLHVHRAENCPDLGPCHVRSPKNIIHLKYHNLHS
jgi:hypothetical protein